MANTYPLPKFHFVVQWGGTRIGFSEVTGLDMQVEAIEYREGSNPQYSKIKMPGMYKFSNITLKRGTFTGDLSELIEMAVELSPVVVPVAVVLWPPRGIDEGTGGADEVRKVVYWPGRVDDGTGGVES